LMGTCARDHKLVVAVRIIKICWLVTNKFARLIVNVIV